MNILYLASEADPLIKVGGLGDVAGTLPLAINKAARKENQDLEIRVVIPYHPVIKARDLPVIQLGSFPLVTTKGNLAVDVFSLDIQGTTFYLLDGDPIRRIAQPYSRDAILDGEKYVFFSLAALKLSAFLNWPIDVLHANDWHTAIAIHNLKLVELDNKIKTILSVHNLPYMGSGVEEVVRSFSIPQASHPDLPDWARMLPLPMGMAAADMIIPVSKGYADEILTPEYGCGLE
jgi:starch synthase